MQRFPRLQNQGARRRASTGRPDLSGWPRAGWSRFLTEAWKLCFHSPGRARGHTHTPHSADTHTHTHTQPQRGHKHTHTHTPTAGTEHTKNYFTLWPNKRRSQEDAKLRPQVELRWAHTAGRWWRERWRPAELGGRRAKPGAAGLASVHQTPC